MVASALSPSPPALERYDGSFLGGKMHKLHVFNADFNFDEDAMTAGELRLKSA
jgi:hypothetical protein